MTPPASRDPPRPECEFGTDAIRIRPGFRLLAALLFATAVPDGRGESAEPPLLPSHRTFEDLRHTRIDRDRIGKIDDYTLRRDAAALHLDWGTVHFFEPHVINGVERVTGAVFVGEGDLTYSPPSRIERDHLAIFAKSDSLKIDFHTLYLRFADDTFSELSEHLEWTGKEFNRPDHHREFAEQFIGDDLPYRLMQSAMLGLAPGFFHVTIGPAHDVKDPYFFTIDPTFPEEVRLAQRPHADTGHRMEIVNMFDLAGQAERGLDLAYESKDLIVPRHYEVETTLEKSGDAKIRAVVDLVAWRGPLYAFAASLYQELRVRSVATSDGRPLEFHHEPKKSWSRIFLADPLAPSDSLRLVMEYEGRLLEKDWWGVYFPDPIGWYPQFGREGRATYDLTFSAPKPYQVVSGGEFVESRDTGKRIVSRYRLKEPVDQTSFNVDQYNSVHSLAPEDGSAPPVTVYMTDEGLKAHAQRHERIAYDAKTATEPPVLVARDVSDAARLFCWYFDKCAFDSIAVTGIVAPHGISFPGLLHLPIGAHHSRLDEAFHGHEVAHQWWGLGVAPRTYHDAWLAEGLAEYFGYRYAAWSQKDDQTLYDLVGMACRHVIKNRKTAFRERRPIAPLWFGLRANSSETAGDYSILVYEKGAVVLHMIRDLLLDLSTDDESAFIELMRDFYARHEGRDASTRDFQRVVEEHVGIGMDWFFDQWVYGTEIPTYEFGYGYRQTPDGNYSVRCTVTQRNVSADFQMYVILKVEFEGGEVVRFRVLIDEPATNFALPPLPSEPKNIVLNDLYSALAEVDQ